MTPSLIFLVLAVVVVVLAVAVLRFSGLKGLVPLVVVQIMVGIALGPSVLGRAAPGANTYTVPTVTKPAYLGTYVDPIFGTSVTRISGDQGSTIPVVGGTWSNRVRATYETQAAWNADDSQIFLIASGADGTGGGPSGGGSLFPNGTTYAPGLFHILE